MLKQYTKEELWELYQKLPQELQGAIFAEETANQIRNICERYNIEEKIISEMAKQIGNVLLGILPPEDFQETLEKELKLEKNIAKKAGQEINRFIFYPVRAELEKLYQTNAAPTGEATPVPVEKKEESAEPKKEDTYREPVE